MHGFNRDINQSVIVEDTRYQIIGAMNEDRFFGDIYGTSFARNESGVLVLVHEYISISKSKGKIKYIHTVDSPSGYTEDKKYYVSYAAMIDSSPRVTGVLAHIK